MVYQGVERRKEWKWLFRETTFRFAKDLSAAWDMEEVDVTRKHTAPQLLLEGEGGDRGEASSTQHHREDGPTSSLGHVSMGREQCVVVVSLLKLKLWS